MECCNHCGPPSGDLQSFEKQIKQTNPTHQPFISQGAMAGQTWLAYLGQGQVVMQRALNAILRRKRWNNQYRYLFMVRE
jgi:hypothetical protein